jgi:hypothetical protein
MADGSTTELEGGQSIGLGQDLGMQQRLAKIEKTAAKPVGPGSDATSFHDPVRARGFYRRDAVARCISPLDEDGVLAGRTAITLVTTCQVEGAVILNDSKRNRRGQSSGRSFVVEVDDRSHRGFTLIEHLARHRVETRRVSTSRANKGQDRGDQQQ